MQHATIYVKEKKACVCFYVHRIHLRILGRGMVTEDMLFTVSLFCASNKNEREGLLSF